MRESPSREDLARLLALIGLRAEDNDLDALAHRVLLFQETLVALDRLDLGIRGPAFVFKADPGED